MTHMTGWSEERVLDWFWLASREPDVNRIDLLRQLADVQLQRPSDWDRRQVREAMQALRPMWLADDARKPRLTLAEAQACWACLNGERWLYWHHVITVGHGGSSTPRNLVPLCHRCHRAVHPHLPEPSTRENRYGWTSLADVARHVGIRIPVATPVGVREE